MTVIDLVMGALPASAYRMRRRHHDAVVEQ